MVHRACVKHSLCETQEHYKNATLHAEAGPIGCIESNFLDKLNSCTCWDEMNGVKFFYCCVLCNDRTSWLGLNLYLRVKNQKKKSKNKQIREVWFIHTACFNEVENQSPKFCPYSLQYSLYRFSWHVKQAIFCVCIYESSIECMLVGYKWHGLFLCLWRRWSQAKKTSTFPLLTAVCSII